MLGQPMSMLIPQVLGFRLHGELPEGTTATDLVLTVTEMLREHGVVGKFVEFYGAGVAALPLADRATIGNMSPEYGSTCAIFPIDERDARLPAAHRAARPSGSRSSRPTRRSRACGTTSTPSSRPSRTRSSSTSATVEPSLAGPKRPQDRVAAERRAGRRSARRCATTCRATASRPTRTTRRVAESPSRPRDPPANGAPGHAAPDGGPSTAADAPRGDAAAQRHGRRRDARRRELRARPRPRRDRRDHVLHEHLEPVGDDRRRAPRAQRGRARPAPQAVGQDLARARLEGRHRLPRARRPDEPLEQLGFNLVGYGCTTCIGNSGPLARRDLARRSTRTTSRSSSVLSGNRNFEGRINPDVKMNYLASPPLCVAYALAGHDGHRPRRRAARPGRATARTSTCATSGPPSTRSPRRSARRSSADMFRAQLRRRVRRRRALERRSRCPTGERFAWDDDSTYVRRPPYFEGMPARARRRSRTSRARACSRCSATASPPTTSRRPARSSATARRAPTCRSTASSRATSTPTARAAATTR